MQRRKKLHATFYASYQLFTEGRAIAQAVSRWLPTAAGRVRARVWSCGICGGQSGAGAGFLRVLRFPLPIFIPPIAPQSPLSIIWGLYNRPEVAAVPSGLSSTPLRKKNCLLKCKLVFRCMKWIGTEMHQQFMKDIIIYLNGVLFVIVVSCMTSVIIWLVAMVPIDLFTTLNISDSCWQLTSTVLAVPQLRQLVFGFPPWRPGFEPKSGHVGFVVDKVALGQVFCEYVGFPCQFLFHRLLHIHHHLSSGAGTIGQLVADVTSGFSLTPPKKLK
jgi:hypothetical protein